MRADSTRQRFFDALPVRSRFMLMAFIFCIFAPASVLVISPLKYDRSFLCLGTFALMGGITAAGYAYSFLHDLRGLFFVVPLQPLWFILPFWFPKDFHTGFTPSLEGALLVTMIVTAYLIFILFFQNEGVRTIRMITELSLAKQIHGSLIPPINATHGRLELYGRSVASAEMGGDLIDVVHRNGATDIIIADVSGHGVRAGVIMAVVKSAIHTRLRSKCRISDLLGDVNSVVCELAGAGMFVTGAAIRFENDCGEFCGAGHGPILHYSAAAGALAMLESDSPPLGVVEGEDFTSRPVAFHAGDVFLLMTDGLTEVFAPDGSMFGQAPIERLLCNLAGRPLPEIYEGIMDAVRTHGPQSDDQTLLLVRVL